jgi:hypothetical protein
MHREFRLTVPDRHFGSMQTQTTKTALFDEKRFRYDHLIEHRPRTTHVVGFVSERKDGRLV